MGKKCCETQPNKEDYADRMKLIGVETCTDILNLSLREWVLAYLIYVTNRSSRSVPTAARPYAISKTLRKPVWAVEKSLPSLVRDEFIVKREVPLEWLIPLSMPIDLTHVDAMPALVHKPSDLERKEEAIRKLNEAIRSGKRWPRCYFVTAKGEHYLYSILGLDYENSYGDLVFGWLKEHLEPRVLWLPKVPGGAEAIHAEDIDWIQKQNWEAVPWDDIDSHLEMLNHPEKSQRLQSLIWLERWRRLQTSRKHARVRFT
jgi:hypothetical protein